MEQRMNAARGRVDETRQRFDEVDRKSDELREQIDRLAAGPAKGSRFLALRLFLVAAALVIIAVTLGAWWLMGDRASDRPASTRDAAMSDVK
jgi:hypothetical protein